MNCCHPSTTRIESRIGGFVDVVEAVVEVVVVAVVEVVFEAVVEIVETVVDAVVTISVVSSGIEVVSIQSKSLHGQPALQFS